MSFQRRIDGFEPVRPEPVGRTAGAHDEDRVTRSDRLAHGTLACPRCDAPVALSAGPQSPASPLECPFCRHRAALRDFLSLTAPSRPARVEVRVVTRAPPGRGGRPYAPVPR